MAVCPSPGSREIYIELGVRFVPVSFLVKGHLLRGALFFFFFKLSFKNSCQLLINKHKAIDFQNPLKPYFFVYQPCRNYLIVSGIGTHMLIGVDNSAVTLKNQAEWLAQGCRA